jgi:hypothetical protein
MNRVTYPRHKIAAALEVGGIWHNLPQEVPQAFAETVVDILCY